jgi:trimeric autotransporter adhesin
VSGGGYTFFTPTLGTTPATPTAPTVAPPGLAVTGVGGYSITLSWGAVSGATSYKVERALAPSGTWAQVAQVTDVTETDLGLALNTNYRYRVRASNGGGDGPYTGEVMQATPASSAATIAWNGTFATTGTTLTCNSCHGRGTGATATPPRSPHMNRSDCATCHPDYTVAANRGTHLNGTLQVTADCITCHAGVVDMTNGETRRDVVSEFKAPNVWSHKRSGAYTVSKWDCIVCHMEGDKATGDRNGTFHANGVINLRDPDTGNNIQSVTFTASSTAPGSYTTPATPTNVTFTRFSRDLSVTLDNDPNAAALQAIMVNQCLKCHDSNGASNANAQVPTTVMPNASAAKPFGTTISTTTGYSNGTLYPGGTLSGVTALSTAGGVTDIKASFATSNSSYHPILGKQNNSYVTGVRAGTPWSGVTKTNGSDNQWGALMSCWDCHAESGTPSTGTGSKLTKTVTAHGGLTTVRGNPAASGATPTATNGATLCAVCHTRYENCGSATNTCSTNVSHGSGSAFSNDADSGMQPFLQYGCNRCHGSDYTTAVIRPIRAMDVHGVNVLPPSPVTAKTGRWASTTADNRPWAFIRNTRSLSNHQPARTTSSTGVTASYTPGCTHLNDSPCNSRSPSYSPGGTY